MSAYAAGRSEPTLRWIYDVSDRTTMKLALHVDFKTIPKSFDLKKDFIILLVLKKAPK